MHSTRHRRDRHDQDDRRRSARARWATASPRCSRRRASTCGSCDVAPADARSRARQRSRRASAKFVEKGKLTAADRDAALGRLSTATDLDALADADYVVEAIVERRRRQARRCSASSTRSRGRTSILASNTSSISITVLGAATKRPDKVLGMHFMNPVPLMTLVELIRGQATSAESMTIASELCTRARQDGGRSGRLSRLHRQPHPDADDQRGDLRGDGRRRHARGDRHGDEARA